MNNLQKILSYGFAQLIDRIFSFMLMPILLYLLSVEQYAVWSQVIIVVGIVTPILHLGAPQAIVKFFPGIEPKSGDFFSIITIFITLVIVISISILFYFAHLFADIIFANEEAYIYIYALGILIGNEVFYELISAKLRHMEKIVICSILLILKSLNRLTITSIVLFISGSDLSLALNMYAITSSVISLGIFIKFGEIKSDHKRYKEIVIDDLWKFAKISTPFVPLAFIVGMNNFSDRFFIMHFLDMVSLGHYAAVYSLVATSSLIYTSIGFIVYPSWSKIWSSLNFTEKGREITKLLDGYFLFLIPFITGAALLGPDLVYFIASQRISTDSILCLGLAFSIGVFGISQLLSYALILQFSSSSLTFPFAISMLINVITNFLLIPYLALYGAVAASIMSNCFLVYFIVRRLKKYADLKINELSLTRNLKRLFFPLLLILILNQVIDIKDGYIVIFKIFIVMICYLTWFLKDLRTVFSI